MTLARIALVDDEASVRVALSRVLRLADFEVLSYASGEEFLASVVETRPDCALLDVHLPGMTGIQVQLCLRSSPVQFPVVFITASDDPAVERDALDSGGLCLLRKPFTSQALIESIVSALRQHPAAHHVAK